MTNLTNKLDFLMKISLLSSKRSLLRNAADANFNLAIATSTSGTCENLHRLGGSDQDRKDDSDQAKLFSR